MKLRSYSFLLIFIIACNNPDENIYETSQNQESNSSTEDTQDNLTLTLSVQGSGQTSVNSVELEEGSRITFHHFIWGDGPRENENGTFNIHPTAMDDSFFIGWEIDTNSFTGWEDDYSDLERIRELQINQSTTVTAHFADISFFGLENYAELFHGFDISTQNEEIFTVNLKRFIDLVLIDNHNRKIVNPLWAANENGSFNIYFHFESWNGNPITATNIQGLIDQYQEIIHLWIDRLNEYDSRAPESLELKIFGFVFNEGVMVDDSFFEEFGDYPHVLDYNEGTEASPWAIESINETSVYENPYHSRVMGNRSDLPNTVVFFPEDWDNFEHPDGINMFLKKAWFTLDCDGGCPAAGHGGVNYIRLFGEDMFDEETNSADMYVFTHELGHSFFLDDGYDCGKYPDGCDGQNPSIMFGDSAVITAFDHINLRLVWAQQRVLNF